MPKVNLKLEELDGNAFMILGAFQKAAKREGWKDDLIQDVIKDAMSGDYDHLLLTISSYCVDEDYEIKHDPKFIGMAKFALSETGLTEDEVERELEDFIG